MKSAELMVRALENEGVRHIFGLPGEENIDFLDALVDSSIVFLQVRHEQAAAFMADVYGRLTGQPGVCLSTLGPGATNLITGVADANLDSAPLVAITGQAALDRQHKESHQYLDVVGMFAPITKWNAAVVLPSIVPEVVRKAFKLARAERPGATHLDLPEDVAAAEAPAASPLRVQQAAMPAASRERVEYAARLIAHARRPVILAGNGAIRAHACDALRLFSEQARIPVMTTLMAKGAVPDSSPLSLGAVGFPGGDRARSCLLESDLVIAVGYDLVEWTPKSWNPAGDKQIVHVSALPAEVDASYIVAVGVVGDIAEALQALASRVEPHPDWGWSSVRDRIRGEQEEMSAANSFPLRPERVLAELRAALGDEDIVVSDVGAHKIWVARDLRCEVPNTCLISNGFASMGIGVPGAIAAKVVYPGRRAVTVSGDGGFLMNSQELATAVRYGLPCVSVIMNDGKFGLIDLKQRRAFGRASFVDLTNPDFSALARSFGARGYPIEGPDELRPVLEEALKLDVPAVIDCPIDPRAVETLA